MKNSILFLIFLFVALSANAQNMKKSNVLCNIKWSDNIVQKKDYPDKSVSVTAYDFIDNSTIAMLISDEQKIITYSLNQNKAISTFVLPYGAIDFDYNNGKFYILDYDRLYVLNTSGFLENEKVYTRPLRKSFAIEKFNHINGRNIINIADGTTWELNEEGLIQIDDYFWYFDNGYKGRTEKKDLRSFDLAIAYNSNNLIKKNIKISELGLNDDLATVRVISIENNIISLDIETTTNIQDNFPKRFLVFSDLQGNFVSKTEIPFVYCTYIKNQFISFDNSTSYILSSPDGLSFYKLNSLENKIVLPENCPDTYHFNFHLQKIDGSIQNNKIEQNKNNNEKSVKSGSNCVTRTQAWENAYKFRDLTWTATSSNIQSTCSTISGQYFKTPTWVTVGSKISVPYKWGGWTDWDVFSNLADQGRYAGNYATTDASSPCSQSPYASSSDTYVIGDDCSGFVSRCWETSSKYSTSGLPGICTDLGSATSSSVFSQLQPGDVINKSGSHVRLCLSQNPSGSGTFMEASAVDWRVSDRSYSYTALTGYNCLKYDDINDARLRLAQAITISPSTIVQGGSITATYKIGNYGTESWTGSVRLYIIQSNGNEVALQTQGPITLSPSSTSSTYTFTSSSVSSPTGLSYLEVRVVNSSSCNYQRYYKVGAGSYSNPLSFTINTGSSNYTISTSSIPSAGGSTSGGGTYSSGQSCTVTASANSGYTFTNWTESGTPVSTNSSYTFTVSGNRTLVANFSVSSTTYCSGTSFLTASSGSFDDGSGSNNYGSNSECSWLIHPSGATSITLSFTAMDLESCCDYVQVFDGTSAQAVMIGQYTGTSISSTITSSGGNLFLHFYSDNSVQNQGWSAIYNANYVQNYTISTSASPSAGGSTGGDGTYQNGQTCTVTASANSGYTFSNWTESGSPVSTSASYSFTVSVNRTLVANFTQNPIYYTISTSSSPSAGGSTSGAGTYQSGQSCTVYASANSGYTFVNWTESGSQVSTSASYNFTISGNRILVANFSQNPVYYNISTSSSPSAGGSTSGGGTYQSGQSCTVYASANSGYTFVNWTESGSQISTSASYSFTVSGNRTLVANFSQNPVYYSVSTSSSPFAGGSTSGGGTYQNGQTCTVSASANGGYTFVNWTESGSQVSTSTSYTFSISGNRTLVANFTQNPINYTISISSNPSVGGTTSGGGIYQSGQTATVSASANGGYTFINWTESGTPVSTSLIYSFIVSGNRSLVANFTIGGQTVDLNNGLIAYYPLNCSAEDLSGNGNHGTIMGSPTYSPGIKMNCINLVGSGYTGASGDHVLLPTIDFNSLTNFSVNIWVNEQGLTSTDGEAYISYGTEGNKVAISHYGNTLQFTVSDTAITVPFNSNYLNNWVFYSLVYANGIFKGYINGTLIGTKIRNVNISTTNAAIARHWWYSTSTRFIGKIDEVRIYNRAVNDAEIQALSTPSLIPVNGLVAFYPFNGNANDSSGNGNNGTVLGSTTAFVQSNFNQSIQLNNINHTSWFDVDDYVALPGFSFNDFSVSFWMKFHLNAGYQGHTCVPFSLGDASENCSGGFNIGVESDGRISSSIIPVTGTSTGKIFDTISTDTWYHVLAVVNGSELGFYLNGSLIDTLSVSPNHNFSNLSAYVGLSKWYCGGGSSSRFNGEIDDLRIYNRPLNVAEIQTLYDPFASNFSVNLGNDISICANQSITLDAGSNFSSYLWSTGVTIQTITLSGLSSGIHQYIVNASNCSNSSADTINITVNSLPASAGTITGTATVCQNQNSITYTVPSIANATSYAWTLPSGATGTSTTNSITVNYGTSAVSGNITVKGTNSCGDGATSTFAITVNTLPADAGTITGASTVCQGQNSVIYTVPSIANATSYIWSLPSGATGTSTTNSITVNYGSSAISGNITITGSNSCGLGGTFYTAITVNSLPANAGTITGTATVCQGQTSVIYTVPTVANATSYVWTLPSGATGTSTTNSITVNYGTSSVSGNITVKGTNTCGNGSTSTLAITVNSLPANAGTISGTATVCQGQASVTYTVPTVANATSYVWTLPSGATGTSTTNSITVNYSTSAVSGNITVKGHNTCGDGVLSSKPVVVNPLPATPVITLNSNTLTSSASTGNQWYNASGAVNGATSQSYNVTVTGDYYVIVTLNNCSSAQSNSINVNITDIAQIYPILTNFFVYPNPVTNELCIEITGIKEKINFEFLNSIGQSVFNGSLTEKTIVQTASFAPGVYLIKLNSGNTFELKKIIKE